VTSNSLHPGVLTTKLLRTGFGRAGAPVEDGARTSVFLATDAGVATVSGQYFVGTRPSAHHPDASSIEIGERVWSISETLVSSVA